MSDFPTSNRIEVYLRPYLENYVFDRLSDSYLEKADAKEILSDIPIPLKKSELDKLTNVMIARSMAYVIGCDLDFPYRDNYIAYIYKSFGKEFIKPLLNEGVELAASGNPLEACIAFRSVLLLDPENSDGLYCYGRALKDAYEEGGEEDFVGRFKAESLEAFEKLTIAAPDFDMGFYFLGYAYLNLGLYIKAKLTFEEFLKIDEEMLSKEDVSQEVRDEKLEYLGEVREWLNKLKDPVKIETGYNKILSGKYQEGIEELLPYTEDERYKNWWPLYYYLGEAYHEIGDLDKAISSFTEVLKYVPSDISTLTILGDLYEIIGDEEMSGKYRDKVEIVKKNMEEEKRDG